MAAPVIKKAYIQDINRPIEVRHGGGLMFTGDANADRISVSLYDCKTPFALSGSVTATCIRNDGATVVLTGGITGGNTAYAVLEQSCFVVPGPLAVTIRVSAGGVSTTVLKAMYTIDQTTTEEIVDPGHVVPDVSDIVAEYARMQAASEAAEAAAENANEAAQFATDDEWTNGDTLQTGRVYQTLHMANFEEETAGQYLRVISGNVAQAERVNQSGWSIYRYDFTHRMLIRLEAIDKNTPTVQGVLPMAAVFTSGNTETLYSLDSDRTGTYILADALLVNYNTTLNASAIKSVSITAVANRQFEDTIVCLDHAADFDKIVVFGDSIFANYINSTTVGNGVMAQFASLMGLPVVNNAVGGATLSTIQTSPKSVVQQVQDYVSSATPGGTPLYIIDGGTNDQYNGGAGLANLGQYTDGVNGITNTIYGATYAIINALLGFGAQPWQIVICTPIPKGIRGDAAYTATMDAQLTAIAGAMAEIAMVQQCNLINGYGSPFDNLTSDTAKAVLMPDDTHPSVYGAKLYAERIFRLLGVANQQEVASLKSATNQAKTNLNATFESGRWAVNSVNRVYSDTGNLRERAVVEVFPGCVYEVVFTSYGTSSPVIIFADQFNLKLSGVNGESSRTNKDVYVTAPVKAKYLYVTHDTYSQSAVTPSISQVVNCAYSDAKAAPTDALVDFMGGGIVKTDAVTSTHYNAQITSIGKIKKIDTTAKTVYIYPVTAGETYNLYGTGVYLSSNTPIAVFSTSLFDGTNDLTADTVLIADTSSTATDYDLLYTPASNGYVYIATYGSYPQVVVYETAYESTEINVLKAEIDAVDNRVDHTQLIMPKGLYDFSLIDLFRDLESTYIDDFTERESMVDTDHPYTVTGGTATLPTITTGTGATRTGESGVSALFYSKTFTSFPYICMLGRVTGAAQLIKLYGVDNISIAPSGSISYNGVTYGAVHYNAQYCLFYVMPEGTIIIDDSGIIVRVPFAYTQGMPLTFALGFGANVGRLFGYGSYVEFVKMPLTPLDFTRCVAYNRLGENSSYIKAAVRFTHTTWNDGAVDQNYYIPESNPYMALSNDGLSNNPCIKCMLDYGTDAGYRTEIGITPIRSGNLKGSLGGLQRISASADYYMSSEDNDTSENYQTYIFQIHDANFGVSGWTDAPPLSIRINNGRLNAVVTYIDDGDVPAGDNDHEVDEYDLGAFEMDKWMHLEVEARIGWKNTLAPQLIIRINGQERLNLQTPIGFNIVSSGGYVNTHFGLYCPQWHDRAYEHTHREILVTNIRWSGTQKEN